MIERKKIDLSAQPIFAEYIHNEPNSTYNFTNMFMWADETAITYAVVADCLVLFFQNDRHPVSASYPIGNGDKRQALREVADYIEGFGLRPVFRNLSDWMKDEIEELYPGCFAYVEDRAAADYIYETEKLIRLSGKKLHAKRNHYNFFKKTYPYVYKELTAADMPDCMALFDTWIHEKEDLRWGGGSREATRRLVTNFDALPVRAGGIYIDGELIAFSIGEPVSEDTALIHVEYATDVHGAFNAINHDFCEHAWADFRYVNREEDMGLDGLRQAKLAYRPSKLLTKTNAVLIKSLEN